MEMVGNAFCDVRRRGRLWDRERVQSNSVADAVETTFHVPFYVTGIIRMIFTALVIVGGNRNIGKVSGVLVPIMIVEGFEHHIVGQVGQA